MIDLYSDTANLGDSLAFTPIMHVEPCRMHLVDDANMRSVAPIYDGLCEIAWDNVRDDRGQLATTDNPRMWGPKTARVLSRLHRGDLVAIPRIKVTADELAEARAFLAQYPRPCAIKASTMHASERFVPVAVAERIVALNPNRTFLAFGLSPNHTKPKAAHTLIKGAIDILDLPIRKQAACYAVIGEYVGADTGDLHLMLAVGGKCDVLCPADSSLYSYQFFHYGPECWLREPSRVRYHHWNALPLESRQIHELRYHQ